MSEQQVNESYMQCAIGRLERENRLLRALLELVLEGKYHPEMHQEVARVQGFPVCTCDTCARLVRLGLLKLE